MAVVGMHWNLRASLHAEDLNVFLGLAGIDWGSLERGFMLRVPGWIPGVWINPKVVLWIVGIEGPCDSLPIWNTGIVGKGIFPLSFKWRRIQHFQDVGKSMRELARALEDIGMNHVIGCQLRLCPWQQPMWKSWEAEKRL